MTWTVAIDVGGTFTDAVADDGQGRRLTVKVPSAPRDPAGGFLDALRELREAGVALDEVSLVFHGTTIATNAVINDDLARVVLLATRGFGDILTYRSGSRPDAYDLRQGRPKEFVPRDDRIEIAERITGQNVVVEHLTDAEIDRAVAEVEARGPEAVAVAFLFSYLDDDHEKRFDAALSEALPGIPVSLSSDVAREFREYPRTVTTVVNAGLRPIVGNYLLDADREIRNLGVSGGFLVMQSNGGGVPAERAAAEAHKLLVSGPAAGVAGVVALGAACGRSHLLSLDMGGTSADVCLNPRRRSDDLAPPEDRDASDSLTIGRYALRRSRWGQHRGCRFVGTPPGGSSQCRSRPRPRRLRERRHQGDGDRCPRRCRDPRHRNPPGRPSSARPFPRLYR